MNYFDAILLSCIEGFTEFLPISSTGHLVLTSYLFHISQTDFVKSFEIIIQLGAIFSIIVLYGKKLFMNTKILKRVVAAFIPTAVIGFILYKFIKHMLLGNVLITLGALLIGGIVLIVLELLYKEKDHHIERIEDMPIQKAILIGVAQSLSVIPGVSRAAATIIGALYLGTKRKTAVEFSFLLAIPTMIAASGFDLLKSNFSFSFYEYSLLAVGFFGSFVFALFAVKFLLQFIKTHTLIPFGIYRIILSILFALLVLT